MIPRLDTDVLAAIIVDTFVVIFVTFVAFVVSKTGAIFFKRSHNWTQKT
jgi:hypothetical protein